MGTDVYMEWKGKSKEEKDKQSTGFDIGSGDVGYMRASIGMSRENSILRVLFNKKFWESSKALRFEFTEKGFEGLQIFGLYYLLSAIRGEEINNPQLEEQQAQGEKVIQMLKKLKWKDSQIVTSESCCFRSAVMWLNSLFSFYELGLRLEEAKKEPKVYISW